MASDNPTYTAADVISDVENRFSGGTGLSSSVFFPWISYSVQKLHAKIASIGQRAKEEILGDTGTITLASDTLEYTITDSIPLFGGFIRVDVRYGATGDVYNKATPLVDINHWKSLENVSTTYQPKTSPLYYKLGTKIGIIPTATAGESVQTPTAKIRYVKRQPQITAGTDEIIIPYRFIYPVINYVQSKAVQRVNEDYGESALLERKFEQELEEVALSVADEFEEGVDGVEVSSSSPLFNDPLSW